MVTVPERWGADAHAARVLQRSLSALLSGTVTMAELSAASEDHSAGSGPPRKRNAAPALPPFWSFFATPAIRSG